MDFTCPCCQGTSFTLVSNVSGLQLANCSDCGKITPLEIGQSAPLPVRRRERLTLHLK
jgi:transcription elongation factor Elf1